jgi:hypothetical protein
MSNNKLAHLPKGPCNTPRFLFKGSACEMFAAVSETFIAISLSLILLSICFGAKEWYGEVVEAPESGALVAVFVLGAALLVLGILVEYRDPKCSLWPTPDPNGCFAFMTPEALFVFRGALLYELIAWTWKGWIDIARMHWGESEGNAGFKGSLITGLVLFFIGLIVILALSHELALGSVINIHNRSAGTWVRAAPTFSNF